MKHFHVNTHPDYITIRELIHYGESHPDLWVQKLAELVSDINDEIPLMHGVRIALADNEEKINNLTNVAIDAEECREDAEKARDEAIRERNALRFDLEKNEQQRTITELKARLFELGVELSETKKHRSDLRDTYGQLAQEHQELTKKYNTWTIISS